MASKTKFNRKPILVAGVMAVLLVVISITVLQFPKAPQASTKGTTQAATPSGDVKVYHPHYEKGDLKLDPVTTKPDPKVDEKVFAVNSYLENLKFVAKDARLEKCTVVDGVAHLEFTKGFDTTYGTEDEQTIIRGISQSLLQFPGIKKMHFMIEGRPMSSLGNIDLSEPLDLQPTPGGNDE